MQKTLPKKSPLFLLMSNYNGLDFEPPAPVAEVLIRDPENQRTSLAVSMLLDSGADVTLIPQAFVERLGLKVPSDEAYELEGFDGSRSFAPVVVLEMIFLNRAFRGRYLLIDQTWGILGRDILNHVSIVLDGPQLKWLESSASQ